ncbi:MULTISPECIES: SIMPL domain-containing protein [unclassified Nostoc]|uniref:SIMPL domain-containing protein n=1 Tax=unclassified Nostoc TaxID=2593658 RepID=UPI002AD25E62|nr:SIMPL domain-containing protein [Nostoc sp. DedQUE03]MDZ7973263.1 SIMPL domain-containing protein [Nostoc sp. DedQUE03]MDZ8049522.1 SIMPL domain-containing protein [Nostoc sp. DedQUE02]
MTRSALPGSQFSSGNLWKILPLAMLLCATFVLPALAQEKDKLWRTLSVSGRGVETIPTTLAQVNLGVEIQGKTAQGVQQEAAQRSSAVVAFLKSKNVEKLQTTGIRLNPVYSYTNNVQQITGYAATNTVSFRIPVEQAGTLLDDAVKAGATQINGISFVANDEAIAVAQKQALKEATQDARQQADAVFSALGFKSKEIVSIQVNNASAPPPPPMFLRAEAAKSADASTPIVGGEQQVEASVTLQISY